MKKERLFMMFISLLIAIFIVITVSHVKKEENKSDYTDYNGETSVEEEQKNEEIIEEDIPLELTKEEIALQEISLKMEEIECLSSNTEEWFIAYKNIINEYADVVSLPVSIYDCYSNEELNLLFGVVQAEIGDEYSFYQKCNVASVIFNRINHGKFGTTMKEVLNANQFSTVASGICYTKQISDTTKLACEYVFEFGSTAGQALYFESIKSNSHSSYATYLFSDGAHKFYY